ncbi:hypothetical protein MJ575_18390 [Klebsiella pneumoniae]|nr:hypothetical protein MJ575_18390 [Klebsiella pneumoniae]
MATVLKTYQPPAGEEYRYWMAGRTRWLPAADKRAVRMADGAALTATGTITTPRVPSPG